MPVSDHLKRRMDFAIDAASEAGKITLRYFQKRVDIELKADRSPVTVADREAEACLFRMIGSEFPADACLGEEQGERPGTSGFRWIVDPIDGTRSFVQGVPLYGVMVALTDPRGEPVVGVVHFPALGEVVAAARGEGCLFNGRPARVSAIGTIAESCVVYTSLEGFDDTGTFETFQRVRGVARITRSWGDCYGHMLVATGRAEVMLDPVLADWDCAALQPILEEAGGTVTDWRGNATIFGKSGISTNGRVTGELRRILDTPAGS